VTRYPGAVYNQLNRVFNQGTVAGLTEGMLLERFVAEGDEAAFGALVARHGPMVLGVCRRILRDEHDVEDAFQATFLVLVRRAAAIRDGERVGHWLHGVAHRVAVRSRAQAAVRNLHETNAMETADFDGCVAAASDDRRDMRAILDEELARLPGTLRSPVVLCYLEGCTHDEAAKKLHWPVGTVRSRMARARDLLRRRLARRGLVADGTALAAVLARQQVPSTLFESTVHASLAFTKKQASASVGASATATALARGVLQTMMISKFTVLGAAALAGVLALGGARTLARQLGTSGPDPRPIAEAPKPSDPQSALLRSVEKIDDLLDDVERRNRDLQTEVRALRKEIIALRSAGSATSSVATTSTTSTTAGPVSALQRKGIDPRSPARTTDPAPGAKMADDMPATQMPGTTAVSLVDQAPGQFRHQQFLFVVSPRGDKVARYNTLDGTSRSLRLSDEPGTKHSVLPVFGANLVALSITGPKISRIAVLSSADGRWYSQDLREPAQNATPIVGAHIAAYTIGRYVYAFSTMPIKPRWDVLELPAGSHPRPFMDSDGLRVGHGSHIYIFTAAGKWSDIDTNALLDAPQGKETEQSGR
jgi:RNA polymerase sigma factor (sigma-70 family)